MRKIFTLLFLGLLVSSSYAQDPHLSMFYSAPQQLNPALTGAFNGNYRAYMLYRSQWGEILRDESVSQFRTIVGGADLRLPVGKNAIGIGLAVLNDMAAESRFGTTRAGLSLAYHQSVDKWGRHFLTLGLQADLIQRSFSPAGLRFGNQWDAGLGAYNPNLQQDNPAYLASLSENFTFFDVGAGLLYYMTGRNKRLSAYSGVSFQHINEPNQSFGNNTARLPIKFSAHGGVNFPISKQFGLQPKFLFQSQGQSIETLFGADFSFIFDEFDPAGNSFKLGALYRLTGGLNASNANSLNSESIALITGVDFKGLGFNVAYDINISQFTPGTFSRGGFEVGLSYVGGWTKNVKTITTCPKF